MNLSESFEKVGDFSLHILGTLVEDRRGGYDEL